MKYVVKRLWVILFLISSVWSQLLKGTGLELDDISDFKVVCENFTSDGKKIGFTYKNVEAIAKQVLSRNGIPSKPIDDVSPNLYININVIEDKTKSGASLGYTVTMHLKFLRYVKYSAKNNEYVDDATTWSLPNYYMTFSHSDEVMDGVRYQLINYLDEFSNALLEANGNNRLPKKRGSKKDLSSQFEKPIINKNFSSSASSSASSSYSRVIEGRIDGDFEGWEGETIVKLMNGDIWQQTEYYYYYHYAYSTKVTIIKSGSSYKMKVDGVEKTVAVIKLK